MTCPYKGDLYFSCLVTGATLTLGPDLLLLGASLSEDGPLTQQDLLLPFDAQLASNSHLVLRGVRYEVECPQLLRLQKLACDSMPQDIQVWVLCVATQI